MQHLLIIAALVSSAIFAAEPSPEQLQTMREFGLSVPPVLLDKNGNEKPAGSLVPKPDKPLSDRGTNQFLFKKYHIPDIANDVDESVPIPKPVPKKEIIAEFQAWGSVELPVKKTVPVTPAVLHVFTEITDSNYIKEAERCVGIVVVDCYAGWCTPCIKMKPIMEELAAEMNLAFKRVDVDAAPIFAARVAAYSLPKVVIFENGKIIASKTGKCTKQEMRDWIESNTRMADVVAETPLSVGKPIESRVTYVPQPVFYSNLDPEPTVIRTVHARSRY